MCGLFGTTLRSTPTPALLEQLRACRDTLEHRGPDSQGDWFDENLYVGHRRLSILDTTEAGSQPFVSADGNYVLAVNGEIYNYQQLREYLRRDFSFRSDSDSEVLLHGYAAWGIDGLLNRIEGMYAFSLYDASSGMLYLARDRVGIKPLYVWQDGEHFAWASELKALVALDKSTLACSPALSVDYSAIYDYLTYLYVPTPKSLYKEVTKLEPGCYLGIDLRSSTSRLTRYWSIDTVIGAAAELSQEHLLTLLHDAVGQQLCADVPLGFFLSGGADSSAVVAAAKSSSAALSTFSIGFDAGSSELPYAESVANHVGAEHQAQTLNQADALILLEQLRPLYDEPFADTSALPTYLIARIASRKVKVVLTGDGGDEVFGGYERYVRFHDRSLVKPSRPGLGITASVKRHIPASRRAMRGVERYLLLGGFALYARWMGGLIAQEKQQYRSAWDIPADYDDYWHYREHYRVDLHPQLALQRLDLLTYLPDDILTKVDRATMAHGLEARVPLLATQIVEAAFSARAGTLGSGKALFKAAISGLLPPGSLDRSKQGFSVPASVWRDGAFNRSLSRGEHLLRQGYPELANL